MGGSGLRFGNDHLPKQFQLLGNQPVYRYALETFLKWGGFDEILLVCHPDWIEKAKEHGLSHPVRIVSGEATRQGSAFAGLRGFQAPPQFVVIHDAVRPFVSGKMIKETLDAAIRCGAANTCIPSADTLVFAPDKDLIASIPNREQFLRGQTPQTFRYSLILEAHQEALKKGITDASDDCRLALALGHPIAVVNGSEKNIKITSLIDLKLAEMLLSQSKRFL